MAHVTRSDITTAPPDIGSDQSMALATIAIFAAVEPQIDRIARRKEPSFCGNPGGSAVFCHA